MSLLRSHLFIPLLFAGLQALAQDAPSLSGQVLGGADGASASPVPFASIAIAYADGRSQGLTAGEDGRFTIGLQGTPPFTVITTAAGFRSDTLQVAVPPGPVLILLTPVVELLAAEVVERQQSTQLSTRTLINTESITAKELKRSACCDLSESFESNATVDVSFTDAVSGTKALRMLGLDGKYAQMSLENIPFIRGLSTGQGLTLIPGTWINTINVSKGIGTAVNGPNAMTGQIDLCLVPPDTTEPFLLNLYGNSQGRMEANVHLTQRLGPHDANLIAVHGNLFDAEMDQNNDTFMDMPRTRRFNVMDRWLHRKDNVTAQLFLRYVTETRDGGQTDAHAAGEGGGGGRHYRLRIGNELTDVIGKYGFIFRNDPSRSIGMMAAFRQHHLSSTFGDRSYEGGQRSFYASAVHQMLLGDGSDDLKAGLTLQVDDHEEQLSDSSFARNEVMPGAFAEYTMQRGSFTGVAGLRVDRNSWFGTAVSPRLHLKHDLGPLTTARLSVGHAFRTALPLVENASVLASSRVVRVEGTLPMERAWNVGASFMHKWKWLGRRWAFTVDGYTTRFTDQVVNDLDRSPQQLVFYGLQGRSFANSVLTDVQVGLTRRINAKVAYRWYDVRTTYDGVLRERPFTPTHRGLFDVAYESRSERFRADASLNLFGAARIPSTASNPEAYRFAERSPAYATVHAQVTWVAGAWELYVGGENLTSTLQTRQIIAPDDPFGPYFDASLIWGPTNRAMIYGGMRYLVQRKPLEPRIP